MGQAERKEQIYLQWQVGNALYSWRDTSTTGAAEISFESLHYKTN